MTSRILVSDDLSPWRCWSGRVTRKNRSKTDSAPRDHGARPPPAVRIHLLMMGNLLIIHSRHFLSCYFFMYLDIQNPNLVSVLSIRTGKHRARKQGLSKRRSSLSALNPQRGLIRKKKNQVRLCYVRFGLF